MERMPLVSDIDTHRDALTRRYDYGLSTATPLHADSNLYPEATPLEVDVHEGIEIGILLSGRQERHLEDVVVPVLPGEAWLCATWEPHCWQVTAANTRDVVLIFLPEFLGEEQLGSLSWLSLFAAPASQRPRVTTSQKRAKVLALGREVLREIEGRRPGWESAIRIELLRLLLMLSRDWTPPPRLGHRSRLSTDKLSRIAPALGLAQTQQGRPASLDEAAQACGLSRAQFSVVFRDVVGLSFGRFSRRLRLGLVVQLLLATDRPVAAIATETGFVDASHLHRAFVKHYGCTPKAYRLEHKAH